MEVEAVSFPLSDTRHRRLLVLIKIEFRRAEYLRPFEYEGFEARRFHPIRMMELRKDSTVRVVPRSWRLGPKLRHIRKTPVSCVSWAFEVFPSAYLVFGPMR